MIEQHTRTLQKQRDALEAMRQQAENRQNALASQTPSRSGKNENGSHTFMVISNFDQSGKYRLTGMIG
jgi:hypothetical protein